MKKIDTKIPKSTSGLRHAALFCTELEKCVDFYTKFMGMSIEWNPDKDNYYLTSGNDNLALHRAPEGFKPSKHQRLDHLGFIIDTKEEVDIWYDFLRDKQVQLKNVPTDHRDGARSFYCFDPDGNTLQLIYHPPLAPKTKKAK